MLELIILLLLGILGYLIGLLYEKNKVIDSIDKDKNNLKDSLEVTTKSKEQAIQSNKDLEEIIELYERSEAMCKEIIARYEENITKNNDLITEYIHSDEIKNKVIGRQETTISNQYNHIGKLEDAVEAQQEVINFYLPEDIEYLEGGG